MIEEVRRRQRAFELEEELRGSAQFEHIIGNSRAMWELFSRIRRIADCRSRKINLRAVKPESVDIH